MFPPVEDIFIFVRDTTKEKLANTIASRELRSKRLNICYTCKHYNKILTTCNKCGCLVGLKTEMLGSKCDLGLW